MEAFGKNRDAKDGLHYRCLDCARQKNSEWTIAHPERVRASARRYREANREQLREEGRARAHKKYHENPEEALARQREWGLKNPDKVREMRRKNDARPERKRQRGDRKAVSQRYRARHLELVRRRRREYEAKRRQDPTQRLIDAIRRRMRMVINGKSKGAFKLLGYSAIDLRAHLEAQFQPGMSWDNYGLYGEKWHVDHKRPVSSFKLPDELIESFALSNLQPLWATDNLHKHARY